MVPRDVWLPNLSPVGAIAWVEGFQWNVAEGYVRSIHGPSYTRLFNVGLLTMVREFAADFVPPQKAGGGSVENDGGTGLYCGEQDMFCVFIDPAG